MSCKTSSVLIRIGWSDADPDLDPTFYLDADPEPNIRVLTLPPSSKRSEGR
jgi:hypothetical protein